jgi:hypothetical protein
MYVWRSVPRYLAAEVALEYHATLGPPLLRAMPECGPRQPTKLLICQNAERFWCFGVAQVEELFLPYLEGSRLR